MASDNRDWYRDWWRKRTGYVERAAFRISHADVLRARRTAFFRKIFLLVAMFFCAFFVHRYFFSN